MNIRDDQKIAICEHGKPIGLVKQKRMRPDVLMGEIEIVGWEGYMLGERIVEQSPNEVYRRARVIAKEKGLSGITIEPGSDLQIVFTPGFKKQD